jgi:hypothetical protein
MQRSRRRNNDLARTIAQLAAAVLLIIMLLPGGRQMITAIGTSAMILVGVAVVGFLGFSIFRIKAAHRRMRLAVGNPIVPPGCMADQGTKDQDSKYQPCQNPTIAASLRPQELTAPSSTTELIEQLRSMDWFQFEKLVGHVYRKLGFSFTRRGGANPDGGIDLIIEKDGQRFAVQCKQWKTWNVGVKAIREFLGALTDAGIQQGKFITLRGYTEEAKQLAEKHHIEIVNEVGLARMMESTDARFDPEVHELLHDTRKFCPKCERKLVIRVARKGANPSREFWGCSGYPDCHYAMPIT